MRKQVWKMVFVAGVVVVATLSQLGRRAAQMPAPGTVKTNPKDGAEMVWIPEGEFLMGNDKADIDTVWKKFVWKEEWKGKFANDESPRHKVKVSGFWISKHEVTVAQFRKFVEATGHKTDAESGALGEGGGVYYDGDIKVDKNVNWRHPQGPNTSAEDNHPVVQVSWNDAMAYCKWAGMRLPTEAEWEYGARGGNTGLDGKPLCTFVWGDELAKGKGRYGNVADETAKKRFPQWQYIFEGYDDGYVYTSPVGSFDANGFELRDMEGNVCEWCTDWYDTKYYASSASQDPEGPKSGGARVVRRGSWYFNPCDDRVSSRSGNRPEYRNGALGFRCVVAAGVR